jgi:hypothetical protein
MPLAIDFQGGLQDAWSRVATFVPKLAAALVVLIVGYFIAKLISRVTNRILARVGFDRAVERVGRERRYGPDERVRRDQPAG